MNDVARQKLGDLDSIEVWVERCRKEIRVMRTRKAKLESDDGRPRICQGRRETDPLESFGN